MDTPQPPYANNPEPAEVVQMDGAVPTPEPRQKINKKPLIIGIAAVLLVCCCCLAVVASGAAGYLVLKANATIEPLEIIPSTLVSTPFVIATQLAPQGLPTKVPPAQTKPETDGLGVTRSEMMDFFGKGGAFEFDEPIVTQGVELVMGTHTWLCSATDCAATTLLGPEEALSVVSVAVPTDPDDPSVGVTGDALMMTTAGYFASSNSDIPYQIMTLIEDARTNQETINTTLEDNGFNFMVTYDSGSGVAGLAVSKAN